MSFRGDCVSLSVVDLGRSLLEIADSLTRITMLSGFKVQVERERMHLRSYQPNFPLLSSACCRLVYRVGQKYAQTVDLNQ